MPRAAGMTVFIDGAERDDWETQMRRQGKLPVTLYADGSCPENSRRPGVAPMGAGIVVVSGPIRKEWSVPLSGGTNIRAEVLAIQYGLQVILNPAGVALRLISDSEWSLAALTGAYRVKKHMDLVADTRALLEAIPHRELIHVPGHAGYEGNERCDVLAGTAVRTQVPWRAVWRRGRLWHFSPSDHELSAGLRVDEPPPTML